MKKVGEEGEVEAVLIFFFFKFILNAQLILEQSLHLGKIALV